MSHKFLPSILLACVVFAFPACAQSGDASRDAPKDPSRTATAATNADVLTPEQAKRALDTLQDDQMRARMIDTLRAIANASPQAQAAPPAPQPTSAIPLTADSLGAQLLLTVSAADRRYLQPGRRSGAHADAFYGVLLLDRADGERSVRL